VGPVSATSASRSSFKIRAPPPARCTATRRSRCRPMAWLLAWATHPTAISGDCRDRPFPP
jgi:hypothetical protein